MVSKGNDGTGNIEERDNWETPKKLFDKLDKQYSFDLDCCATKDNRKKEDFTNNFLKFKAISLFKMCWMNPPFSKAVEMFEHFFKVVNSGITIYRCDNMETKVWQDIILKNASWILIPKGRISYEGKVGKGSRFPSALIGFNVEPIKDMDGVTLIINKGSLNSF